MKRDIAIIGMSGRFPDAGDPGRLYRNLEKGKDSVREISPERIKSTTLPPERKYKVCGYLEDIDKFDYKLFNISPAEARDMAPEQRILLETVYRSIENSGYAVDFFSNTDTAVFVTEAGSNYSEHADDFSPTLVTGVGREYLAAKISRQFNLTGCSAVINTSCSSSLSAVHLACNELILGNAAHAVVCGVTLFLFPYAPTGTAAGEMGLDSPDGKSRAFSAGAGGMSYGEVAVSILLKPLEDALKDKDIIHAVIKSTAVNNNAARSASLTAPDGSTQAEVIKRAWQKAGIDPEDIGYIEAHGSGTQLGDSLEIEGLDLAFRQYTDKKRICPISTIKSNIGHGRFMAGLSGLVKTVLSLKHGVIFPTPHFDPAAPNPMIDFENSAVYVNHKLKKWERPKGTPRIACVTSIGAGGINAHVVLEEAPQSTAVKKPGIPPYLFTVSSKTPGGLIRNLESLAREIDGNGNLLNPEDIAFTLNNGRKHYNHRFACIADSPGTLNEKIRDALEPVEGGIHKENKKNKKNTPRELKKLVFIFDDPECALHEMWAFFFSGFPVFRKYAEQCQELCKGPQNENFRIFAFQYSFYKLLEEYGIVTEHVLGIGIGTIISDVVCDGITLQQGITEALSYKKEKIESLKQRVESLIRRETAEGPAAFIHMGPGTLLSGALKGEYSPGCGFYVFCLPGHSALKNNNPLLELFKFLYLSNYDIHWEPYYKHGTGSKIELPGYRFERTRCWLREEPKPGKAEAAVPFQREEVLRIEEGATELQREVARIWREVLEVNIVSIETNFFDGGGDSLKATKVINRITRVFAVELDFEDIFDFPTIKSLCEYIDGKLGTLQKIAAAWQQVLKVERVTPGDNFFELGGHSLFATRVLNIIKKEFQLELNFEEMFENPTLEALSSYVDARLSGGKQLIDYKRVEPVEKKEYYPLSPAQGRLYFIYLAEPNNVVYNIPIMHLLEGRVDRDRLTRAFRKLIHRHESLRTSFPLIDEKPVQRVFDNVQFDIDYYDAGTGSPDTVIQDFVRPFDLSRAPALRVGLKKIEKKKHLLMLDMHHIVTDGISMILLAGQFMDLYARPEKELPGLKLQYKDFSAWQNRLFQTGAIKAQEEYWLNQFKGDPPILNIPTDFPRSHVETLKNGDSVDLFLDAELTARVHTALIETGTTMFMYLLAVYNIFLSKCSGRGDIVVGSPVNGRRHNDLHDIIGMFVNMLPLRNKPAGEKTFRKFLGEVKENALKAYENQDYQYAELVGKLNFPENTSRDMLLGTVFTLYNFDTPNKEVNGLMEKEHFKIVPYRYKRKMSAFDLHLIVFEKNGRLNGTIEYSTHLFKQSTVRDMTEHFVEILDQVLHNPDVVVRDIGMTHELVKMELKNIDDNQDFGF